MVRWCKQLPYNRTGNIKCLADRKTNTLPRPAGDSRPKHLAAYSPDWVGKPATPLNEIGKLAYSRTVTGFNGPVHLTATHRFDYKLKEKQTAKMFEAFKNRTEAVSAVCPFKRFLRSISS